MTIVLAGDITRVANLILGTSLGMVSVVIMIEYARAYWAHQRVAPGDWRGLLPRHVALISTSYLILVTVTGVDAYGRIHEPLGWHAPFLFVAYATGLWAQWDMLGHQGYRRHAVPKAERRWPRR